MTAHHDVHYAQFGDVYLACQAAGSGIELVDGARGELGGVPDLWQLFAVAR